MKNNQSTMILQTLRGLFVLMSSLMMCGMAYASQTPNFGWTIPDEFADPWYAGFVNLITQIDTTVKQNQINSLNPSLTSIILTNDTNQIRLGTGNTTTITMASLTGNRIVTFPDANSNTVQAKTCSGFDKFSSVSASGVFTCSTDQGSGGGSGITSLGGLTPATQLLAVGTNGTDFTINSAIDTHTFNLPTASSTVRGALSSADWSTFNGKENVLTFNSPLSRVGNTISCSSCSGGGGGGITSINTLTPSSQLLAIGTSGTDVNWVSASSTHTLNLPDASSTARGVVTANNQTFGGIKTIPGLVVNGSPAIGLDLSTGSFATAGMKALSPAKLVRFQSAGWTDAALPFNATSYGTTSYLHSHGAPTGLPGTCTGCISDTPDPGKGGVATYHLERFDANTGSAFSVSTLESLIVVGPNSTTGLSQQGATLGAANFRTNGGTVVGGVLESDAWTTSPTASTTVGFVAQIANTLGGSASLKGVGGYIGVLPPQPTPATYVRADYVPGVNTVNAVSGLLIANQSTSYSSTAGLIIANEDPQTGGALPFKTGILIENASSIGMTIKGSSLYGLDLSLLTPTTSAIHLNGCCNNAILWGSTVTGIGVQADTVTLFSASGSTYFANSTTPLAYVNSSGQFCRVGGGCTSL